MNGAYGDKSMCVYITATKKKYYDRRYVAWLKMTLLQYSRTVTKWNLKWTIRHSHDYIVDAKYWEVPKTCILLILFYQITTSYYSNCKHIFEK